MDRVFRLGPTERFLVQILLLGYALVVVGPFAIAFMNSLKPLREVLADPFGLPSRLLWGNYADAWNEARFGTYFLNSMLIGTASTVLTLFLGSMAAFVIAYRPNVFTRFAFVLFLTGVAIPLRIAIIPLFDLMRALGLLDTRAGLVLIYVASTLPFAVFVLTGFIRSVPRELEQAAVVDGASPFRIYRSIVLPLIGPALATVGIFTFTTVWNDFFFPLIFTTDRAVATLPLGLSVFFTEFAVKWNLLFAGLIIMMGPTILAFLLGARYFVHGLSMGGVKE